MLTSCNRKPDNARAKPGPINSITAWVTAALYHDGSTCRDAPKIHFNCKAS